MDSDVLRRIWERQAEFAKKVDPEAYDDNIQEKEQYTINTAYHIIRELAELVDETNWKTHVKYKKAINKSNIIEEYIDVFKFFINLGLVWGITADDVIKEFDRKSAVVEQKWEQENMLSKLKDTDKIAAVDIDGVLASHPGSFISWLVKHRFMRETATFNMTKEEIINAVGSFEAYTELKHQYRMQGAKLEALVLPGARQLLQYLKQMNYKIVLLSARPYRQYVRIFADTLAWLNIHDLPYDAILFDSDKEDVIIKRFPQMKIFIDDEYENVEKVAVAGFKAIWIANGDMKSRTTHPNVTAFYSTGELVREIQRWQQKSRS